jgi:hypothetical protein
MLLNSEVAGLNALPPKQMSQFRLQDEKQKIVREGVVGFIVPELRSRAHNRWLWARNSDWPFGSCAFETIT